MKIKEWFVAALLSTMVSGVGAADNDSLKVPGFSVGTRNTVSMFSDDDATGIGVGGQFRYRFLDRLNSEWFADYIPSHTAFTQRQDYHIGWSLMFYPGRNIHFDHLLQPYLLAGHCFDISKVSEKGTPANSANRFSGATQAGMGTHINITTLFDCSLSAQYMLHFGKEIETSVDEGSVTIRKADEVHADGHLLFTLSFNYKL